MSKSLLLSIKPKYVSMILNKTKTIEVRKRFPLDYRGWVYIYCTKRTSKILKINKGEVIEGDIVANEDMIIKYPSYFEFNNCGKVVARFYCDNVEEINFDYKYDYIYNVVEKEWFCTQSLKECELYNKSCLTKGEIYKYLNCYHGGNKCKGYAIHISQLEIFDKPKELWEFYRIGHYEDFNDYFTDEKRINGKWCIPLTKAPQSMMYIEVEE